MFTKTSDLVAFDLETFRFSERQRSPKVICGGLDFEQNGFEAFSRDALKPRLIELLKNDQTIILHNASYDIGCLLATFPDLTEEIYGKLDRDQIYCSFTAARLLGIAIGHRSMDKLKDYYSLDGCLKRYKIAELVKDKEIQLSYDQVDGLEPDKWPKKYYDYLVDDVIYLRKLVVAQLQRADQLQYRRFKRNVFNETSMAVPFMRMTNRGVLASSKIIQIYDGMKAEYDRCRKAAIEDGFINPKTGSVTKKKVGQAIIDELGDKAPRTGTGLIQTSKEVIADCKSPKLKSIQNYQKMGKYISTFVKPIKNGVYGSIHPGFLSLGAATGRSSCVAPWTKIKTKKGFLRIDELREGDHVWTHKQRWKPIIGLWDKGNQPAFELFLSNGHKMTCTLDHRVLNASGEWMTIRRIINGCFKEVDIRQSQHRKNNRDLYESRAFDYDASCETIKYNAPKRFVRIEKGNTGEETKSIESDPLFAVKAGYQESDAGQNTRKTPSLEGRLLRRIWIPDEIIQRKKKICSSHSDDGTLEDRENTERNGRSSHRQQSIEQSHRQSGVSDQIGAQHNTLFTEKGFEIVTIEEIHFVGSVPILDISVSDDESYFSCGFFSHNSYKPNFQNQPNDQGIRETIIARPGFVLVACDYDSLELRTLAQACQTITGRSVLAEWYNKDPDFDPHSLLATKLCDLSYEEFLKRKKEPEYKALRDLAKATNFTFPGGGGARRFVNEAWAKDRLVIPLERAKFLKKTFVEQWGLKPYFSHVGDITNRYDPIYQIKSGRMRGNIQYPAACNTYFQGLGADVSKTAAVKVDRASYLASLKSPLFGSYPVLFVHDELVVEVPEENAGACAAEIKRLMEEAQKEWCPDVAPGATPAISRNWTKAAQTIIVEGEYQLWEPKIK